MDFIEHIKELPIWCEIRQDGVTSNYWNSTTDTVAWLVGAFIYNIKNKGFYTFKVKNDVLIVSYNYTRGDNSKVKTEYLIYNIPFDSYGGVFNNILNEQLKKDGIRCTN